MSFIHFEIYNNAHDIVSMRDFLSFNTLNYKEQNFGSFFQPISFLSLFRSPASFFLFSLLFLSIRVQNFFFMWIVESIHIIKIQKQAPLNRRFGEVHPQTHTHTHTIVPLHYETFSHSFSHAHEHRIKYAKTKLVIYLMAVIMLVDVVYQHEYCCLLAVAIVRSLARMLRFYFYDLNVWMLTI